MPETTTQTPPPPSPQALPPAQTIKQKIQRANELINWFWAHGKERRRGLDPKYWLPIDSWLAPLYQARDELKVLEKTRQRDRKALALWGPSHAGKSTALSFLDCDKGAEARDAGGNVATDGTGTGLHWEGGKPFFYGKAFKELPENLEFWNTRIYNPINGNDSSSCLTRFVGRTSIDDPMHPVEVKLINSVDLLCTIARGFDSECRDPRTGAMIKPWRTEDFQAKLKTIVDSFQSELKKLKEPTGSRDACEQMFDLVATIKALYARKTQTFGDDLAKDFTELEKLLTQLLLQEPVFLNIPKAAEMATALVLWRGSQKITSEYQNLRAFHKERLRYWGDKAIYCSLEAAMLFVDFNSSLQYLGIKGVETLNPGKKSLIEALGWRKKTDDNGVEVIQIGCGGREYREGLLSDNPYQYARMQALVWELVLPVNLNNLLAKDPDDPGTKMLGDVDLLDFPGVARDSIDEAARINMGIGDVNGQAENFSSDGEAYDVNGAGASFFGRIMKRGKTASIVVNYARLRNIDSMVIMQDLKNEGASAAMTSPLNAGCTLWAQYANYQLDKDGVIPIHYALTMWGNLFDSAADVTGLFAARIKSVMANYAEWIRKHARIWPLNYHWFKSNEVNLKDFTKDSSRYAAFTSGTLFQEYFADTTAQAAFAEMVSDKEHGGLVSFWTNLRRQTKDDINLADRVPYVDDLIAKETQRLDDSCTKPGLLPGTEDAAKARKERLQALENFRTKLYEKMRMLGEPKGSQMRDIGYALRELLNVDPDQLKSGSGKIEEATSISVSEAFTNWIDKQGSRHSDMPEWQQLGFTEAAQIKDFLTKLFECMGDNVCRSIAETLRGLEATLRTSSPADKQARLRHYLAIEMANCLCDYVIVPDKPDKPRKFERKSTKEGKKMASIKSLEPRAWADTTNWTEIFAEAPAPWRNTIEPWFERHLPLLLATPAGQSQRGVQAGDNELKALFVSWRAQTTVTNPTS